jgi:hypothetical protein
MTGFVEQGEYMQNLAKNMEQIQPSLEYGRIVAGDAERFIVQGTCGPVQAVAAASCLIQPKAGDKVLIATDGAGESYILSVLKQADNKAARTRIVFDGQVDLVVNGGGLSLTADADLSLAANEKMAFSSGKISVHAGSGEAVIERICLVAKVFQGQVKRIKMVANTVENTFRRLTQRLQDAFRFVQDHEEIQTGSTRYLVEDTLTINARNAVHMAEEIVTINAEQVHLG